MEKIILTTVDELKEIIRTLFVEERQNQLLIKDKEADASNPELLTREEACALLRIRSANTLYQFMKEQGLPFKKVGRRTLFVKQDIIKFITNKKAIRS